LDEFDISPLLHHCREDMLQGDPSLAGDLKHCFSDFRCFQRTFTKVMLWSLSQKITDPNIESFYQFKHRVRTAVETIVNESRAYKKVAAVTSGGVLALLMQMNQGLSDRQAIDHVWSFYNTSVTIFYAAEGVMELKLKNSVTHLNGPSRQDLLTYV
jgi:broad specificity phosphatase PhoE